MSSHPSLCPTGSRKVVDDLDEFSLFIEDLLLLGDVGQESAHDGLHDRLVGGCLLVELDVGSHNVDESVLDIWNHGVDVGVLDGLLLNEVTFGRSRQHDIAHSKWGSFSFL